MYLKHKNLAVTLNLHDAKGVNEWETQYDAMCKAIGRDKDKNEPVNFTIINRTIALALEDVVLKPLEDRNGVDFWWIDWQQGEDQGGGDGDKKNPTFWTAHLRSTDRNRRRERKRAMVLARWGGLGSHRYPVHFAGDASISWEQLQFQPYFSMTATNVGAIWSHDISGQLSTPELFTRWLQWSVLSGISRVHDKGTSAGECAKTSPETCTAVEPWNAPPQYALANYDALRLRGMLIPYVYTCAYRAHAEGGLWFVRPLYYDWPELDGAYVTASAHPNTTAQYESQYMFGDNLLAAPVVRPSNTTTHLAVSNLWFPPGTWVGFSGGRIVQGDMLEGSSVSMKFDISEIPLFAKAGSIIPTIPVLPGSTVGLAMKQYHHLVWTVFLASTAPSNGVGYVYEDDGKTTNYISGQSAFTIAKYSIDNDKSKLYFSAETKGTYEGILSTRSTTVRFINAIPPVSVLAMNKSIPFSRFGGTGTWSFDSLKSAVVIELPAMPLSETLLIELQMVDTDISLDGVGFKISKALKAKDTLDMIRMVPGEYNPNSKAALMQAASFGSNLEYLANDHGLFLETLQSFRKILKEAVSEVQNLLHQTTMLTGNPSVRSSRFLEISQNPKIVNRLLIAYELLQETEQ